MKTRQTHWFLIGTLFLSTFWMIKAETSKVNSKVIPLDVNGMKMIIAPPAKTKPIKVAIFDGKGAPYEGIENVSDCIKSIPEATVSRVKAKEWATIDLKQFDVVAFARSVGFGHPGGLALARCFGRLACGPGLVLDRLGGRARSPLALAVEAAHQGHGLCALFDAPAQWSCGLVFELGQLGPQAHGGGWAVAQPGT
jgi:hypothetical protein